jgi:hypothetical protein
MVAMELHLLSLDHQLLILVVVEEEEMDLAEQVAAVLAG